MWGGGNWHAPNLSGLCWVRWRGDSTASCWGGEGVDANRRARPHPGASRRHSLRPSGRGGRGGGPAPGLAFPRGIPLAGQVPGGGSVGGGKGRKETRSDTIPSHAAHAAWCVSRRLPSDAAWAAGVPPYECVSDANGVYEATAAWCCCRCRSRRRLARGCARRWRPGMAEVGVPHRGWTPAFSSRSALSTPLLLPARRQNSRRVRSPVGHPITPSRSSLQGRKQPPP